MFYLNSFVIIFFPYEMFFFVENICLLKNIYFKKNFSIKFSSTKFSHIFSTLYFCLSICFLLLTFFLFVFLKYSWKLFHLLKNVPLKNFSLQIFHTIFLKLFYHKNQKFILIIFFTQKFVITFFILKMFTLNYFLSLNIFSAKFSHF